MQDKLLTDLQTQIESIHNTRDFERLINDIFSRINGTDYIASDYHKDGGMDGYIPSSKTLIAKHCFEKPIPLKKTRDVEILKKAKIDLKKAIKLSKNLEIRRWMFITSYLTPASVYVTLKTEVEAAGFQFDCPGASFIKDILIQNKDLIQNHPYLHVGQIDETLQHISKNLDLLVTKDQMDRVSKVVGRSQKSNLRKAVSTEQQKFLPSVFKTIPKKEKSKDFKRVLEIYKRPPNSELEKEIKLIIYSSPDQEAVLQGVHLLASWYRFSRDTVNNHLGFINLGIDTARGLKSLDSESVFLAEKGSLLSTKFVLLDLEGWGKIEMSNRTGFSLITNEEKEVIIGKLKILNKEFKNLFKYAIEKAYKSNNYLAVTRTFSKIGSAAGNRAGHFMSLGIKDRAIIEQDLCKGSFMHAKRVATQFRDEVEMAYVLNNFANALGFMGETDEALLVLKEAVNLAKKHRMNDILENVQKLERLIKEPKIKLVNYD